MILSCVLDTCPELLDADQNRAFAVFIFPTAKFRPQRGYKICVNFCQFYYHIRKKTRYNFGCYRIFNNKIRKESCRVLLATPWFNCVAVLRELDVVLIKCWVALPRGQIVILLIMEIARVRHCKSANIPRWHESIQCMALVKFPSPSVHHLWPLYHSGDLNFIQKRKSHMADARVRTGSFWISTLGIS